MPLFFRMTSFQVLLLVSCRLEFSFATVWDAGSQKLSWTPRNTDDFQLQALGCQGWMGLGIRIFHPCGAPKDDLKKDDLQKPWVLAGLDQRFLESHCWFQVDQNESLGADKKIQLIRCQVYDFRRNPQKFNGFGCELGKLHYSFCQLPYYDYDFMIWR